MIERELGVVFSSDGWRVFSRDGKSPAPLPADNDPAGVCGYAALKGVTMFHIEHNYTDDTEDEWVAQTRRELASRRRWRALGWTILILWLLIATVIILLHPEWWGH